MTPFELKLENDLSVERQRFANKWLFPWHQMNVEGKTFTVEDFRGGNISYGGIRFGDQQQAIFWQAIERYLKAKAHETFGQWDSETKAYPADTRLRSLEGTAFCIRRFMAAVVKNAVDTDQALRGRGYPKTDVPAHSQAAHGRAIAEVEGLKAAHQTLLPTQAPVLSQTAIKRLWARMFDAVNLRPGIFGFNIDLKKLFGWEK